MRLVTLVLALAACKAGAVIGTDTEPADTDPIDTVDTEPEDTIPPCENPGVPFPADGATDVFYRTTVELTLDEADPSVLIALSDGAEVPGSTTVDGTRAVFVSDDPLAPSTEYTATASHACREPSWTFTTSSTGVPTVDLTGRAWSADMSSGRFVEPAGVGPLVQQFLSTTVLIGVESHAPTTLVMIGASANSDGTTQDDCIASSRWSDVDFSEDPHFVTAIDAIPVASGVELVFRSGEVSGSFAPDGSRIDGLRISGVIDTHSIATLINGNCVDGFSNYPACLNAACNLLQTFGLACEDCADGTGEHCLALDVDSITANEVAGPLVARTQEESCALPGCAATCP